MTVPYTHNNLGEETPPTEGPSTPDRHIDGQDVHVPFYSTDHTRTNFDGVPQPLGY